MKQTQEDYQERQTQLLQAYMDIFLSNDTDQSYQSLRKASILEATVCKSFLQSKSTPKLPKRENRGDEGLSTEPKMLTGSSNSDFGNLTYHS